MQDPHFIQFKKKREIGDVITDTFKFIRRNFKAIFRNLFKIIAIPFLLFIVASAFNAQSTFNRDFFDITDPTGFVGEALATTLILYAALFLYMAFMFAGVTAIIKSYISNEGKIVDSEVTDTVKNNIGNIIIAALSKTGLLLVAYMLCFFPGVYVAIPLFILYPLFLIESKSVGDAISYSFELVKDHWWTTFATVILLGLLWYLISVIFSLPSAIYVWVKMFTSMQESSFTDPSTMFDTGTVIFTVVASALQYLCYFIMPIGAVFVYYNLNEHKNQTGTLEKIDQLGS